MFSTTRRLPLYQVDAFTEAVFGGNPAAVVPLDASLPWLSDATMQAIAAENALSETAFLRPQAVSSDAGPGAHWQIRWFTPTTEVDLCGHATLASAHVLWTRIGVETTQLTFHGQLGPIAVDRGPQGYRLALPRRASTPCAPAPGMVEALGRPPEAVLGGAMYLLIYPDEASVAALAPDMAGLMALDRDGVIVSAPADDPGVDFVSRYFLPAAGIPEDPVTGSAHCQLVPYWAERLGRTQLSARQISRRGGALRCALTEALVHVTGRCADYLEGTITVPA